MNLIDGTSLRVTVNGLIFRKVFRSGNGKFPVETFIFANITEKQNKRSVVTTHIRSLQQGNFLHLSVILFSGGCLPRGSALGRQLPGRHPPGRQTHTPPGDGHCSGQYASYYNAFSSLSCAHFKNQC